jgi:hypothetical protein
MKTRIADFCVEHLAAITPQEEQGYLSSAQQRMVAAEALAEEYLAACTLMHGGRPVACAGLLEMWPGRCILWALIDRHIGAGPMCAFVLWGRGQLRGLAVRRVEAMVLGGFAAGARLMRLLGFVKEGTMRGFCPQGRDYDLWAFYG